MAEQFKCKEPNCDELVTYEPLIVFGLVVKDRDNANKEKIVYLKCPKGHTHAYTV